MIEYPSTDPTRMMTFVSAKRGFGAVVFGGIVAIFLIITVTTGKLDTVATPGNAAGTVVVLTFFASIFLLAVTRRWTAEVDLALRRLKISRRSLAGRTKVV